MCSQKHTDPTTARKRSLAFTNKRTYTLFFLPPALQVVSHPSIHVTERWVHPVTGQLVAVTLIYVAPLSSMFLLWWKNYVFLLPIRNFSSAYNGELVRELSQIKAGKKRSLLWTNCMMVSWLCSITSSLSFRCFVIRVWMPEAYCFTTKYWQTQKMVNAGLYKSQTHKENKCCRTKSVPLSLTILYALFLKI